MVSNTEKKNDGAIKESLTSFGEVLADIVHQKRMTQYEFALKANVSQSYISRIEKGVRPLTQSVATKFAAAFGTDPDVWIEIFQETEKGSHKPIHYYRSRILGTKVSDDLPGSRIRQFRHDDIVKIFADNKTGEVEYNGRLEDTEISDFHNDFVNATSYDTRVGGYVNEGIDGDDEHIEIKDELTIKPTESILVSVKEHITLPSWIEAEIHPASNIGKKHLIVSHGPVIDPGWSGFLIVSVFNPTKTLQTISVNEPFLTLRFWMSEL